MANVSAQEQPAESVASNLPIEDTLSPALEDVSKVGEYQSQDEVEADSDPIAVIQPHPMDGRPAATIYVNNIPVLTFLGSGVYTPPTAAVPDSSSPSEDSDVKVGSTQTDAAGLAEPSSTASSQPSAEQLSAEQQADPVWRATAIAARINQLYQDEVNADAITVRWDEQNRRYLIEANQQELVVINETTILPDTTRDPAEDALQATNRLRRLLGGAAPLREVAGRPRSNPQSILSSTGMRLSGLASWYGPGFNGRRTASGEVFNQNALTAAHRTLPFGTQVRVTNPRNGQSVIVRITDRGPYSHGRLIDLSAGAARAIGIMGAGVGSVNLEVLGTSVTASN
ncbi:MAG TPA: septal ring lytic transglycosylase RlpA family protein [Chroococcidiopsis sp.]